MPGYLHVLFDLDHTLFDFDASKAIAFAEVLASVGVADAEPHAEAFTAIEEPLWRALEAGDLTLETLNDQRWAALADRCDLGDPAPLAAAYLRGLGANGGLYPGAREVLDAFHGSIPMGLITNGYAEVQRPRLERFDLAKYFDAVVISGEAGVAKPDPAFFAEALRLLGNPPADDVLVVGDSLTSDIAGGVAAGIPTCWYNPHGIERPAQLPIDHEITDLEALPAIVLGS